MPLHIPLPGVQVYDYEGTDIVHSHDTEVSELNELDGAYVKKKEITLGWLFGQRDKAKVSFDLKSESLGVPVYARLYRNGAVKGVQQSESGLSYVTKLETLSGLADGDKIQLYLHGTPGLNFAVCDRDWDDIKLYSGITGTITEEFDSPSSSPTGLAFDGVNLLSCDWTTNRIYVHDGLTAAILRSFASPDIFPSGLTVDGSGNLISCDRETDRIYVHDGITAAILRSFASPSTYPSGLTVDGNGNLISCDLNSDLFYVHVGVTDTILRSFASQSNSPSGLAFDGVNLLSCDYFTNRIYVHDGITDAILKTINYTGFGTNIQGITTYHYPAVATAYAKNLRIIGGLPSLAEELAAFENTL